MNALDEEGHEHGVAVGNEKNNGIIELVKSRVSRSIIY
jgi:hypothetical protein